MSELDPEPYHVPSRLNRRAGLWGIAGLGLLTLGTGTVLLNRPRPEIVTDKVVAAPKLKDWPTLDAAGEQIVAAKLSPGLSLSVMHDGVMLYSRGFGVTNLTSGEAVTPQTGFRIASITKHFTAAAVMLLAEAGALSVDDPLARFLPEFPRAADITLRQLLSHTAGLSDYINGQSMAILEEARNRDYSSDELLDIINRRKPLYRYEPGRRWAYSNSGFSVLGIVAERVSGRSLADIVAERIAAPAGLTRTAMDRSCHSQNGCTGYRPNYRAPGGFDAIAAISPSFAAGAGALRSTTEDLCLWQAALMKGAVLKPSSVNAMLTPARLKDGTMATRRQEDHPTGYGFGLALGHEGAVRFASHGGRINGFTGHLRSFPDQKLTIAVLYNSDGGGAPGFVAAQRGLRVQATALAFRELGLEPAVTPSADGAG